MSANPNPLPSIIQMASYSDQAKNYMDSILVDVAVEEIMDPLRNAYLSKGAAQSYIDSFSIVKQGFLKMTLENNHRFAQWLEDGTEPHIIEPTKDKKALHWSNSSGEHFAKIVHHPGFGGYNVLGYMLPGLINRFIIVLVKRTNEFLDRSKS